MVRNGVGEAEGTGVKHTFGKTEVIGDYDEVQPARDDEMRPAAASAQESRDRQHCSDALHAVDDTRLALPDPSAAGE